MTTRHTSSQDRQLQVTSFTSKTPAIQVGNKQFLKEEYTLNNVDVINDKIFTSENCKQDMVSNVWRNANDTLAAAVIVKGWYDTTTYKHAS